MQNTTVATPEVFTKPNYFRAPDGVYKLIDSPWGSYYSKVPDPKGKEKPVELEQFHLNPEFSKLPAELLQAIITLFRVYLKPTKTSPGKHATYTESTTEVQVTLLRNEEDPNIWKVVVPKQVVGSVTVDALLKESCDILTGEEYNIFPPLGWVMAGSTHSHHSMSSFWSGRDDMGELGVPGMHCTVGRLTEKEFSICCSIVLNGKRYIVEAEDCLDLSLTTAATPMKGDTCHSWMCNLNSGTVHSKVHEYITQKSYVAPQSNKRYSLSTWAPQASYGKKKSPRYDTPNDYAKWGGDYWTNSGWDSSDWATKYDYRTSKISEEEISAQELMDYLNSNMFQQELNGIVEMLYTISSAKYDSPRDLVSLERLDAIDMTTNLLIDLFEILYSCPGMELALLKAVAYCYSIELKPEMQQLLAVFDL